jgi:hypothetical protein
MPDLSPEARVRADRTIAAAVVFSEHAERIAAALPDVPAEHVLVAVVDSTYRFTGTHHVHTGEMVERVPELEQPEGWAMVFTPGASAQDVQRRVQEWISINEQRIAAIDRILARRAQS